MKKLIQLQYILLVLTICDVEAQEFQGSAFYFAKTNVNTDFTKNSISIAIGNEHMNANNC